MADSTNNIDIVVKDSVDAAIAPKLIAIADASDRADKSTSSLKAQLQSISLSSLGAQLGNLGGTTGVLSQQTDTLRQKTASLSTSQRTLSTTSTAAAQSLTALSTSAEGIAAALAEEQRIQEAVNVGISAFNTMLDEAVAESAVYSASIQSIVAAHELSQEAKAADAAQQQVWGATLAESTAALEAQGIVWAATFDQRRVISLGETVLLENQKFATDSLVNSETRLLEIQSLVSSVMGASAAATEVDAVATEADTVSKQANAAATGRMVSGNVSGAAALGILEGRTLSMNRAATNFLTKILGLGPALQSAFVVIGAVALIAVIYQAYEAFDKFITKAKNAASETGKAFDGIYESLRKSNDTLAVTNDKLDQTIAKLEHKPTTNGAQLALDQATEAADRLDASLERVSKELDKVLDKNRIGAIGALFTGQADTKDTENLIRSSLANIDKAREDARNSIDAATDKQEASMGAYGKERSAIKLTLDTLNTEYNTRKKLQDVYEDQVRRQAQQPFVERGNSLVTEKDQTAPLTQLGEAVKIFQQDLRSLDLTSANIGKNSQVDKLRDQASGLKVAAKEAAAEWKQLLADFIAFETAADLAGHKATAQQSLTFLQSKEPTINSLNRDKLTAKELPFQNKVAGENFGNQQIEKLALQAANMNLYGTALKETTELDRIFQEAEKKGFTLSQDQIDILTITNDYIHQNLQLQQEKTAIQKQAIDVEEKYTLAVKASEQVMSEHPELADAIGRDLNRLKIAHDDAKNPVLEFNRGIDDSRKLLGQYGDELKIETEVQNLANSLRSKGVGNYQELAEAQRANITQTVQEQIAQKANEVVYNSTTDAINKLTDAKEALNAATATELSDEAKQSALARVNSEINDKQLETGQVSTKGSVFGAAVTDYAKQFTTIAAGIKQTFQGVFKTLADGFADSIGRAIVYAHNLGDALKEVARSAISELISGLIKLGIQYLILYTMKKLFGQTDQQDSDVKKQVANQVILTTAAIAAMLAVTAAGTVAASTLSAAWWPVAEAVSLASFGANAIPASIGIATVQALGQVSSVPKLDVGTNYVPYDMLAQIHKGEAVIPAADNRALRAAVGASPTPQVAKPASNAPGSQAKIEFHDHVGVALQVQQMDEGTVRLIVRQESPALIQQHAPGVIAREVQNPNSSTSKSISRNVTPSRVR
jgi:hypothetical protein